MSTACEEQQTELQSLRQSESLGERRGIRVASIQASHFALAGSPRLTCDQIVCAPRITFWSRDASAGSRFLLPSSAPLLRRDTSGISCAGQGHDLLFLYPGRYAVLSQQRPSVIKPILCHLYILRRNRYDTESEFGQHPSLALKGRAACSGAGSCRLAGG